MDNFLPTRNWNPPPFSSSSASPKETSTTTSLPTPPQPEQWKSPPYSSRNELTRDSLYKSPLLFSSTNMVADQQQQQQHSPTMQQHHNKPLESSSYFQYTSKAYHLQQQQQQQQKRDLSSSPASSSNSYHNATVNKVDQDINQVVLQCNTLCDNMIQHKDQFINNNHEQSSTRLLLDDMIGRANEVLNALLRLRKHQIASEQYQSNLLQQAAAAEQQHHHHQQQSNGTESDAWRSSSNESVTNINNHARQRKRGVN